MVLTVKLGATVVAETEGHSAANGAPIDAASTIELTSNAPDIATVPATVAADGSQKVTAPVTVVAVGSADIHVKVTAPDGSVYEDTSTLVVEPTPEPGIVRVSLTLVQQ